MPRLADRHVLREIWVPFLIGVFTFVVILLADTARHLSAALTNQQTPTILVFQYLVYRAPAALVWSLPVGTLLGVCMAVTRLTREGEVTAMRAGGIGFPRICGALFMFGAAASMAAFALNEYVVPRTTQRQLEVQRRMLPTQPFMKDEDRVLFRGGDRRIYYIEHMDARNRLLTRLMIVDFNEEMRPEQFTLAARAQGAGEEWHLLDGFIHRFDKDGRPEAVQPFDAMEVNLGPALRRYVEESRSEFEMGAVELREAIQARRSGGHEVHQMAVEYHFKFAIPAACLVFALVGAPLSFRFARHGGFMGLLLAILVVFLYNGVRSWARLFGLAGLFDPAFAAWLENVLFGALGLYWLFVWR